MALPTVVYDATNGSDTAASGAGPSSALTGTNAFSGDGAGGGTQTEIDLSGDTPDLSGVATDGSDVLYLATSSGDRHLFKITAVNDGTDIVTVELAPTNSISSGAPVSWAIGGERKTLINDTSRPDWEDWRSGWIAEFQDGTYDIDGNQIDNLNGAFANPLTMRAASGVSSRPTIRNTTGNANRLLYLATDGDESNGYLHLVLEDLYFHNEDTWAGATSLFVSGAVNEGHLIARGCKFESSGGGTGAFRLDESWSVSCEECEFKSLYFQVILVNSGRSRYHFSDCWIHTTATTGSGAIVQDQGTNLRQASYFRCVFSGTGTGSYGGIALSEGDTHWILQNCTFYDIPGDAVYSEDTDSTLTGTVLYCLFQDIGGYAIDAGTAYQIYARGNAFRSITSGHYNNEHPQSSDGDVTLTADAMTDPGNGDFSLNDTSGGGADCRGISRDVGGAGSTTAYPDIGAVQHQDSGGGGTSSFVIGG